jgi:NTP pyrophosphatase (non-canonical NTP hydrolase)
VNRSTVASDANISMELTDLIRQARETRALYQELETRLYGRSWTLEDLLIGFMGDVGELAQLVQANTGIREIPETRKRLEHELADCLWSVLVLADKLDVDIEKAFSQLDQDLRSSIRDRLDNP